jgi:phosphatidylserine decarboxylase
MSKHLRIKLEQFRQARRIHGGVWPLALALLAIKMARLPIPRALRPRLYRDLYRKKYPPGLNEDEADRPLLAYPSFNALFTRGLKPECRPVPAGTPQFLSPCDGTVQDVGRVEGGRIFTLKGVEYTLASLLPQIEAGPLEGGHFVILFLSPLDCHRVLSPQDGHLEEVVHVPGYRLLVHPPFQRAEYPVYTLNERVILRFSTGLGPCLVVMVAGWGVGNITLPAAPHLSWRSRRATRRAFTPPAAVRRGDWVATFELGSTVVLLTPPSAGAVQVLARANQEIKYGQPVLTYPG